MKPFEWYVDRYNMVGKSRHKAAYRFSKQLWDSLMQYRQWEKEAAVEQALKDPEVHLLYELSRNDHKLQCYDCQTTDWWGGSAMTGYTCQNCKQAGMWGSTAIPTLCMVCSFKLFRCYRCGDDRSKDL
jgi:hypothetical protein